MTELLLALLALVLAALLAALLAVALNRVPLLAPPGPWRRLQAYLTRNLVETSEDSVFPERAIPAFRADPDHAYAMVKQVVGELGWQLDYDNPSQLELGAVVTTPLLRFTDDVKVKILPSSEPGTVRLLVRSRSRLGRGDLGANTRHLLDLYAALGRHAGELAPAAPAAGERA